MHANGTTACIIKSKTTNYLKFACGKNWNSSFRYTVAYIYQLDSCLDKANYLTWNWIWGGGGGILETTNPHSFTTLLGQGSLLNYQEPMQ